MLKQVQQQIKDFETFKQKHQFEVIDSHVHPFDVMGVMHQINKNANNTPDQFLTRPSIIEKLNYGKVVNLLAGLTCYFFPQSVNKEIASKFKHISENRILHEMRMSFIDQCILVPIEPWSKTVDIAMNFQNPKFITLGSIDIHNVSFEDIRDLILMYKNKYKIRGVKLHPNLQNFNPQPSYNDDTLEKKLSRIYEVISELGLYLLIHGGRSFFTKEVHHSYRSVIRSKSKGILNNFINRRGESELFENYKMPIVISHLGHYGYIKEDLGLLQLICRKYSNVFFDTSGTSPALIEKALKVIGSEKIIFGSDAVYNSMLYNLIFTFSSIKKSFMTDLSVAKAASDIYELNIKKVLDSKCSG